MKTTEELQAKWTEIVRRLNEETTFNLNQVRGICFALLSQKIDIDKRIAILEELINLNPKQSTL
jgi:hypothetical protein